eukprot:CAMPEP_0176307772 /NCGR_PEP_ID=MMETSP0121_2-20121125/64195_1 /TAXON_ID=160619 /ORGANISM="Kryptoperidinium foliaceum, Strain CCMP 1326" /LENGTH=82 /DNA_ID=CAMNT_0017649573 /DNA_START=9 /DNA_END=254 /DNA_ORIENTATION=-
MHKEVVDDVRASCYLGRSGLDDSTTIGYVSAEVERSIRDRFEGKVQDAKAHFSSQLQTTHSMLMDEVKSLRSALSADVQDAK